MSAEQIPQYHYKQRLHDYDTDTPKKERGHISTLTEMLDNILYAEHTTIRANSARATKQLFESQFRFKFPRQEVSTTGLTMTAEFLQVSIDHRRYLGKSAIEQCYKVKVESIVRNFYQEDEKLVTILGRTATVYNLQQLPPSEEMYLGTVLRPRFSIPGTYDTGYDEPITVYDCENLGTALGEVLDLIREDQDYTTNQLGAA